jgi:tRNA (guanine37-N1)-methyltransferase
MIPSSYDVLGNIAIMKFASGVRKSDKIKLAKDLLKEKKSVTTVLEKSEKVKGRLRKIKTDFLAGVNTKVAEYKENNCRFVFDVDETYFSPRLSNERKEISEQVGKNEKVLVMFAGVAPFSIVIAKNSKPKIVYSVELNRKASKYAEKNVLLNKVGEIVKVVQGDVKKVSEDLKKEKVKFDRIVMARPQLKDSFLDSAFKLIKKNGVIHYYGFAKTLDEVVNIIESDSKKLKKKIKIFCMKKAGDIGPYRWRWRIDFKVL